MKSVLISINPKWCDLIVAGKKTIEVRKSKPNIETPFKVYIYQTLSKDRQFVKSNGKVFGEFVCEKVTNFDGEFWDNETFERIQEFYKPDDFDEFGEYEYKTIATNECDNYKENWLCKQSCVSWEELRNYMGAGTNEFFGWRIHRLY